MRSGASALLSRHTNFDIGQRPSLSAKTCLPEWCRGSCGTPPSRPLKDIQQSPMTERRKHCVDYHG